MSEVINLAAVLCRRFEGLRLKPYTCPAGVPTIGYGSTRYEDGTPVKLTDPEITKDRADELLDRELSSFYQSVVKYCPVLAADSENKAAAILSWTYNLGAGRLKASTMRKRINQQNWNAAATELKRWVWGGGRRLPGLIVRRDAEAELLLSR